LRRFVVCCAVVSALVTALYGYLPLLKGMSAANLMAAGERLDAMAADRVEVFTLPQERSVINPAVAVPLLDLYTAKPVVYRDGMVAPPDRRILATSPLRFTWEFDMPPYYEPGQARPGHPGAGIATHARQPLPDRVAAKIAGLRLSGEFALTDGLFRFGTVVRLYGPPQKQGTGNN
jgi:hypothetical protein